MFLDEPAALAAALQLTAVVHLPEVLQLLALGVHAHSQAPASLCRYSSFAQDMLTAELLSSWNATTYKIYIF